jgi:hypothetical protein
MLGVRCAQDHAFNARVGQRSVQVVQKINADLLCESPARGLVQVAASDQLQNIRGFDLPRNGLTPPAQTNDGDSKFAVVAHADKRRVDETLCNLSVYQQNIKLVDPDGAAQNFKTIGSSASPCASTRPMMAVRL